MEPHVRAALAYIAGRLVSGKNASGVYDYSRTMQIILSGAAQGGVVSIYDHNQGCHISGSANGLQYLLFHHGLRRHICLTLAGSEFTGHDYGRSPSVSGWVIDDGIVVVEPAMSKQFGYTLMVSLDPPWTELENKAEPEEADPEMPPT